MLDYNYWSQIIIRVDYGERWVEWKKYEQQGDRDDVQEIPSSEHVLEKIKSSKYHFVVLIHIIYPKKDKH